MTPHSTSTPEGTSSGESGALTFHVEPEQLDAWSAVVGHLGQPAVVVIHGASGLGQDSLLDEIAYWRTCVCMRIPEAGRDLATLRLFIASCLAEADAARPVVFLTYSLFVMREVELAARPTCWVGLHSAPVGGLTVQMGPDFTDSGDIIALDEELAQAERYMDRMMVPSSVLTIQATAAPSGPPREGLSITVDPLATVSVSVSGLDGRLMEPPKDAVACGCTAGAGESWLCQKGNIPGVCTRRGPCGCACHRPA